MLTPRGMGMLSFLGLGGGELSPKQIEKISKLAQNPYAQADVRKEQIQKLLNAATPESIRAALGRWTVNASQAIADEDEKRDLVAQIAGLGEASVEPLKDYMRKETALSFAIEALAKILSPEQTIAEVLAVLDVYPPDDHRSDEQKRQIILFLAGENDPRILPKLAPYIGDHSDDVRTHALDVFAEQARKKNPVASSEEVRRETGALLRDKNTSPRVAKKAAEIAAELEWSLPETTDETPLSSFISNEFFVDKKGYLRRRVKISKA